MHSTSKPTTDLGIRDLSHLTEEEQVEYLIKMTEEEAKIDFRAGVELKSPGMCSFPILSLFSISAFKNFL